MSVDNSNAEAALYVLDKWFWRRAEKRYDELTEQTVDRVMGRRVGVVGSAEGPLRLDFEYTFPHKKYFFTWMYGRRGGYLGYLDSHHVKPDEQDTTVLGTVAPVYEMISRIDSLARNLNGAAGDDSPAKLSDEEIDRVFAGSFKSLDDFIEFCTAYLRTRLLTADLRTIEGTFGEMPYEMQARNFKTVKDAVWVFAYQLFGDILN